MKLSDFDFTLPEGLIATRPVRPRTSARLLLAESGRDIQDLQVTDLPNILLPGDRLVLNNTKVIPARLSGVRQRMSAQGQVQAAIAATLLDPVANGGWRALLRPLKKIREGEIIRFSEALNATLEAKCEDGTAHLRFNLDADAFDAELARIGAMPLPPYIASRRPADARDKTDYQTVFARHAGAVAAPTASLHFDDPLLETLRDKGIEFSEVTLHVGAGTFLPVKVDDIRQHKMHAEWGEVTARTVEEILQTQAGGGRIIPVGTTALRLIETASADGRLQPWRGFTDIFIRPGYEFRVADGLLTNFHLPKSTLMMLVSAFMSVEEIRRIYAHAIENRYRFFSYGDASLLLPAIQRRR